ncbi:sulfatase-like hydrolase/transferase [Lentisphaera marina]|uniref:sulfatase-like hydrolase/transferase n=1 Tax=Lentisphaera marina TaxID=1111041 RepID=UPI002365E798|nr:sulfatase-like hydrolase/transferase [Lentisphaera marina]MDD7985066.1 sulfatase-like hydrolase/transferase [Lentisphaera marina]
MYKTPTKLIILLCCVVSFLTHAQDKPNVVFILSDDHGWMDYSFMGHPHVKTPHIDRLAGEGLVYDRGYDTASMCRPSLASIVTGLYPHQTAVRGNHSIPAKYIEAFKTMDKKEARTLTRKHAHLMTASLKNAPSMVKQLNDNGYATFKTGKWWEGDPLDQGFEDKYGIQIGRKTMKPIYDFVNKAQEDKRPFFIWYGVFLPHTPHNAPDRLYQKYKDLAPNESTARYWANIAWLDETCGQLVNFLKEKDLYDNTLFVYASDNGWLPDPNEVGGYIRSKKEAVEIGIRTPIFLTHKKTISPQRDKETLASAIDIAPTILKACGIEPDEAMSGLDLRKPDLLAKRDSIFVDIYDRDINIDAAHKLHSDILARVVVNGWYKLIARPGSYELYDLKNDPDDRKDISAQHPEKVKELTNLMDQWLQDTPMVFSKEP